MRTRGRIRRCRCPQKTVGVSGYSSHTGYNNKQDATKRVGAKIHGSVFISLAERRRTRLKEPRGHEGFFPFFFKKERRETQLLITRFGFWRNSLMRKTFSKKTPAGQNFACQEKAYQDPAPQAMNTSNKWIISKIEDTIWIIGSIAVGYFFLSVFYTLQSSFGVSLYASQLTIYFIWIVIFDGTHIFATYVRTYFDAQFRKRYPYATYATLLLLIVGPVYCLYFYTFGSQYDFRASFVAFNRFGMYFAYYHLIRQHWGFMCLYNSKAGEISVWERKLEGVCLASGTAYPVIDHYLNYHQSFGLGESLPLTVSNWTSYNTLLVFLILVGYSCYFLCRRMQKRGSAKVTFVISTLFATASIIIHFATKFGLDVMLAQARWLTLAIFLLSGLTLVKVNVDNLRDEKIVWPKLSLLLMVLVAHNSLLKLSAPYVVLYACLTMFHNVQYHRIIRYYCTNKYMEAPEKYGFASVLTTKIFIFILLALAFNFVSTLPRAGVGFFVTNEFIYYMAATFFWGIAFHHYVLDSIIWRPSKDKDVKLNLKLKAA